MRETRASKVARTRAAQDENPPKRRASRLDLIPPKRDGEVKKPRYLSCRLGDELAKEIPQAIELAAERLGRPVQITEWLHEKLGAGVKAELAAAEERRLAGSAPPA